MRRCLLFGISSICQHWLSSVWWHYRSDVSCITVTFYCCQLKGEYLQGHSACGWEWKEDSCVQGWPTREPCSACITFCRLQTQGAWAKLILAMPSWGIPLPTLSTATACWFCWFGFFRGASEWPPTSNKPYWCTKSQTPAALVDLSHPHCQGQTAHQPPTEQCRNVCQLNLFICLNGFNPWSSWWCSLSGNIYGQVYGKIIWCVGKSKGFHKERDEDLGKWPEGLLNILCGDVQ